MDLWNLDIVRDNFSDCPEFAVLFILVRTGNGSERIWPRADPATAFRFTVGGADSRGSLYFITNRTNAVIFSQLKVADDFACGKIQPIGAEVDYLL